MPYQITTIELSHYKKLLNPDVVINIDSKKYNKAKNKINAIFGNQIDFFKEILTQSDASLFTIFTHVITFLNVYNFILRNFNAPEKWGYTYGAPEDITPPT